MRAIHSAIKTAMALYCHFQTLSKTTNLYIQTSFQHNDSFLVINSCYELKSQIRMKPHSKHEVLTPGKQANSGFACAV